MALLRQMFLDTGGAAQAVGGPFDKDGAIGKQFTKDGAVGTLSYFLLI